MADFILSCCSTADLSREHFEKRGISFICFHFELDGTPYMDDLGKSIPFDEFYQRMTDGADTKTSQINVEEYCEYFEHFLQEGKDILHLTLSSGISGSVNSARIAQGMLREKYPELAVCGTHDGYFQDAAPILAEINELRPDVLFVCLGAGKQEQFMYDHRNDLNVGLMIGLGGSLDGIAGNVKRAPQWMIKLNLEWLYRLIKEPWRIGRMMRLPKFLLKVLARRMKG